MNAPARRLNPQLSFLALAILVNVVATSLAHAVTDPSRRRAVEFAAAADMTVTVSALYYWLVVRPGLRPKISLLFVALVGLLRASFAFPQASPGKAFIGGGVELALIAALVVGFRRARQSRADDPVDRIQEILSGLIPIPAVVRALAGELSVLYYASAWRAKPHVPAGSRAFTLHNRSGFGDLILFVGLASLLEVVPVHLVVARWSGTVAWVLTALSLYGALWAFALGRSFALRPTLVTADALLVRFGLLFSLRIPFTSVRGISPEPVPGAQILPRNTEPAFYLEFTEPLEARMLPGLTKRIASIGLSADDSNALYAEIVARRIAN